jgi:hypothetical protein
MNILDMIPNEVIETEIFQRFYDGDDLGSIFNLMKTETRMFNIGFAFLSSKYMDGRILTSKLFTEANYYYIMDDRKFLCTKALIRSYDAVYCKYDLAVSGIVADCFYKKEGEEGYWLVEHRKIKDIGKYLSVTLIEHYLAEHEESDDGSDEYEMFNSIKFDLEIIMHHDFGYRYISLRHTIEELSNTHDALEMVEPLSQCINRHISLAMLNRENIM